MKKKKVHKVVVHNVVNFVKKPQLVDFLYKLRVVNCAFESVFVSLFGSGVVLRCGVGDVCGGVGKKWAALPCGGSAAVVYFLIPILGIVSWLVCLLFCHLYCCAVREAQDVDAVSPVRGVDGLVGCE